MPCPFLARIAAAWSSRPYAFSSTEIHPGVAHLSGLHTLDLTLTRVTDKGVAHLSRLHTLLL